MEDVLKTYEKPLSESEPVVCVDENPVVLHKGTQPSIPMQPGLDEEIGGYGCIQGKYNTSRRPSRSLLRAGPTKWSQFQYRPERCSNVDLAM
jgi:hypothetical protein